MPKVAVAAPQAPEQALRIVVTAESVSLDGERLEELVPESLREELARSGIWPGRHRVEMRRKDVASLVGGDFRAEDKRGGPKSLYVQPLFDELTELATVAKQHASLARVQFRGVVVLEVAPEVSFKALASVIYTAGQAQWSQFSLAVEGHSGSGVLPIHPPRLSVGPSGPEDIQPPRCIQPQVTLTPDTFLWRAAWHTDLNQSSPWVEPQIPPINLKGSKKGLRRAIAERTELKTLDGAALGGSKAEDDLQAEARKKAFDQIKKSAEERNKRLANLDAWKEKIKKANVEALCRVAARGGGMGTKTAMEGLKTRGVLCQHGVVTLAEPVTTQALAEAVAELRQANLKVYLGMSPEGEARCETPQWPEAAKP